MQDAEVIDDFEASAALSQAWDALAVQTSSPYASPHWLRPWWEHVAPRGSRLHVVALRDDRGELIGLGPWYLHPSRSGKVLRPLGASVCDQVGPLARAGHEQAVATGLMRVLDDLRPRASVLSLEGLPTGSPWPAAMTVTGRARVIRWRAEPTLSIPLSGRSFDDWFMSKRRHFRQRMRKLRRDFEAGGGTFRLADAATLEDDLASLARLHRKRWAQRGGSNALVKGAEDMLLAAGRDLVDSGRMRVWSLDLNGATVSSHVLLAAGNEIGYWLAGFDEERGPGTSMLGFLHLIEDAFAVGAERLDLGRGRLPYKQRFADTEELLAWDWVLPRGLRGQLMLARLTPQRARVVASKRLPAGVKARLRVFGRLSRSPG